MVRNFAVLGHMKPMRARESWFFNNETGQATIVWALGESTFNIAASFIWSLCDGQNTVDQIVSRIVEKYPAAPVDTIFSDVAEFLYHLAQVGLLNIADHAVEWDNLPMAAKGH